MNNFEDGRKDHELRNTVNLTSRKDKGPTSPLELKKEMELCRLDFSL